MGGGKERGGEELGASLGENATFKKKVILVKGPWRKFCLASGLEQAQKDPCRRAMFELEKLCMIFSDPWENHI